MYAVVKSGGKQYRVAVGEMVDVEKLPAAPGDTVTLDQVLLVSGDNDVQIGQPMLSGASVKATVVSHGLGRKDVIFHYRPKERYRVKRGHRQPYTRIRIEEISA